MGCDIWTFAEKKVDEKYNLWKQVKLYRVRSDNLEVVGFYEDRNYELFSLLAGVRGWHEPLIEPRGVPQNMSTDLERQWNSVNEWCHTPTWYSLSELFLYRKMFKNRQFESLEEAQVYKNFINFVNNIETYLEFAGEFIDPEKYRVVLWFDS